MIAVLPEDSARDDAHDDDVRAAIFARRYLRWRRERSEMVAKGLFEDPAWDMLLDLFIHHVDGKLISVTSACIASGVAATTALRWIDKLGRRGLVVRHKDQFDGRRTLLGITDEAARAIEQWLNAAFAA